MISCHQTDFSHHFAHCFPHSFNIGVSSKVQGCIRRVHCIVSSVSRCFISHLLGYFHSGIYISFDIMIGEPVSKYKSAPLVCLRHLVINRLIGSVLGVMHLEFASFFRRLLRLPTVLF